MNGMITNEVGKSSAHQIVLCVQESSNCVCIQDFQYEVSCLVKSGYMNLTALCKCGSHVEVCVNPGLAQPNGMITNEVGMSSDHQIVFCGSI